MMVYWLPEVTPDPICPTYVKVTDWPATSWTPPPVTLPANPGKPPLVKFPEMVREKLAEKVLEALRENVRENVVELKAWVKLNCPSAIGFRVLLLCTTNTTAPSMQAGSANPVRVWFVCEALEVLAEVLDAVVDPKKDVEEHPLPGVTSRELIETGCAPVFWIVTKRLLLETAALLITTLPSVVEVVVMVAGVVVEVLWVVVLELWLEGARNM